MLNSKLLTDHPQWLGGEGCGLRSVLDMYTIRAGPLGWPETPAWKLVHRMRVPGLGSATCSLCGLGQVTAVPPAGVLHPLAGLSQCAGSRMPRAKTYPLPPAEHSGTTTTVALYPGMAMVSNGQKILRAGE